MKVQVIVTVDVDVDEWCDLFGIHRDDIRDDVKTYFHGSVEDQIERASLPATIAR